LLAQKQKEKQKVPKSLSFPEYSRLCCWMMLSRFCPKPGKDKIYFIQDKTKSKKVLPVPFYLLLAQKQKEKQKVPKSLRIPEIL